MTTSAPIYQREIVYDRETRDYAMYLDNELVGFARTFHEAEVTLDQLVFELLSGQHFAETPADAADLGKELIETGALKTATELDAPDVVYSRPAEIIEPTYVALPSAPSALTDTVPSVSSFNPSARQESAAGATQPTAPALTIGAQVDVGAGRYTGRIVARLDDHLVVELDGKHDELPTALCWRSEDDTILWPCLASELTRTTSPGALLLRAYDNDPDAFLATFDRFGPPIQARITFAVAAALGRSVGEVDAAWTQSRQGRS